MMEKTFPTVFSNVVHQQYHMKQQYTKQWKNFKNQIQWWREENIKQLCFNSNEISNPSVHRATTLKTTLR
jgi:predicted PurR-regulated permease PerM